MNSIQKVKYTIKYCKEQEDYLKQDGEIRTINVPIPYEAMESVLNDLDYYKLRFTELNKQWNKVRDELLGEDYYNYGCDWKSCDELMTEDLIYKYKKKWWQFWK